MIRMRPSGLTTTLPSWVPERRVIVPPWANPNALKLGQRVAETCRSGGSGCALSVSDPEFPERWSSTESAFPASQWRVRVLSANPAQALAWRGAVMARLHRMEPQRAGHFAWKILDKIAGVFDPA